MGIYHWSQRKKYPLKKSIYTKNQRRAQKQFILKGHILFGRNGAKGFIELETIFWISLILFITLNFVQMTNHIRLANKQSLKEFKA